MESISIIGGGIAGLALAACLDPDRFEVTVTEKRPELPVVGTVLAMWPNAQRALETVGILDDVRRCSPAISSGALRDAAGTPWVSFDDENVVGVSRIDLLRLLDAAVPDSVRRITKRVDTVPSGAELPSGPELVVGADGVHSAVRRSVWGPHTGARLTPYLAVRGVVPVPVNPDHVGEYWGRGDLFGIGPIATGTLWFAGYRSGLGPTGIDVASTLEEVRLRFAGHGPAIRQVLAGATPELSLAQRIWRTPLLRSYVRGNAVLIGDAAHAMTPNLGRGACESLVDAVTLAGLLNTRPRAEALRTYDRSRRLRTQGMSLASSAVGRVALAEAAQPLRDRLLAVAGRRKARAAVVSGSSR
ncbi:FAD-dependent monooxygenase [Pseudarthrobacter sp. DSP2-3-2b1]|uniref:FAD-dependent monooxygenase n=1 Tax=Pseudarthrobacter sp. DSP2-3-2b1 TaxID=2804661 RepID=UPI003CF2854D